MINPANKTYRPGLLHRSPGLVLILGIVLSVGVHAGSFVWLFGEPIGYVDPNALMTVRGPIRIKRAMVDMVLDNPTLNTAPPSRSTEKQNASEQGKKLLETANEHLEDIIINPELELRPAEVIGDVVSTQDIAIEMPAYELPADALEMLDDKHLADVGYQDVADVGFGVEQQAETKGGEHARRLLSGDLSQANTLGGYGLGKLSTGIPTGRAGTASNRDARDRSASIGGSSRNTNINDLIDLDQLTDIGSMLESEELKLFGGKPEALDADFDYLVNRHAGIGEPGWFEVEVSALRSLSKLPAMRKDVVYLVDTSGSIDQEWINQVRRGIGASLSSLNEGDRFNIVLFNEKVEMLSEQGLIDRGPESHERAMQFLWKAKSKGATDVNAALGQLLVRDTNQNRVLNIILISDGMPTRGVMDTRKLINLITRDNDLAASIYCVGIGNKQNHELLNFLAYRNKGYSIFVEKRSETMSTISDLLSRLRYPIIKDLRINVVGKSVSEVYPLTPANIHQGERFSILGRYTDQTPFTLQIMGYNNGRPVDFTLKRNLAKAPAGSNQIAYDWAFWKLHHLYSQILKNGYSQDLKNQVEQLRRRYKLKTLY
ncbi:VWA domain-containing protein [Poriferisphaera sp. WC338]|uniref:VWA domain-containing protein n=1 Tax=Poriferisphaera sp. WC338 TaxID=3425129 RepID=UPI003D815DA2